eukprot:CAMPEP_0197862510 /NCGR_PEP_ID=MMETSP1438-20131217/39337_1 /TAXON_ID=1461541 /ORGANISM="Pterosperma sp., Strain CCMP1384" /LENGTH=98 /DNA_ID=CAMNT_0043480091 /DNA_START=26 /DNA_END=319 /DNA_ORIENTATION=+
MASVVSANGAHGGGGANNVDKETREAIRLGTSVDALRARKMLFLPGGPVAKHLAHNPTVLVVNDTVFAHGGLLPAHIDFGLTSINNSMSKWMRLGYHN